jgi:hypothetical protein
MVESDVKVGQIWTIGNIDGGQVIEEKVQMRQLTIAVKVGVLQLVVRQIKVC